MNYIVLQEEYRERPVFPWQFKPLSSLTYIESHDYDPYDRTAAPRRGRFRLEKFVGRDKSIIIRIIRRTGAFGTTITDRSSLPRPSPGRRALRRKKGSFCSPPRGEEGRGKKNERKKKRKKKKDGVHHCGRSRTQGADRSMSRERKPGRGVREGRGESPAVHLLCRGLLRSRIKSVSGCPLVPTSTFHLLFLLLLLLCLRSPANPPLARVARALLRVLLRTPRNT